MTACAPPVRDVPAGTPVVVENEIALIAGTARTATVVAATDLRCLTVTAWDFRRLVESDPEISWRVLTAMAAQLLPRIGVPGGEDAPAVGAAARPR